MLTDHVEYSEYKAFENRIDSLLPYVFREVRFDENERSSNLLLESLERQNANIIQFMTTNEDKINIKALLRQSNPHDLITEQLPVLKINFFKDMPDDIYAEVFNFLFDIFQLTHILNLIELESSDTRRNSKILSDPRVHSLFRFSLEFQKHMFVRHLVNS